MGDKEKMNISFKIEARLYMQFKAVLASFNAEHGTRYNVSQELMTHIRKVVNTGMPDLFEPEEVEV